MRVGTGNRFGLINRTRQSALIPSANLSNVLSRSSSTPLNHRDTVSTPPKLCALAGERRTP
jgi:hypothetical protein